MLVPPAQQSPPQQQSGPYVPPVLPVRAAPSRRRRAWLIAAVALVVVGAVAAISVLLFGGSGNSKTSAAQTVSVGGGGPSSPTRRVDKNGTYRVIAANVLPSLGDVQQATLFSAAFQGDPLYYSGFDAKTTPANCALAASSTSLSAWGAAPVVARRSYNDNEGSAESYSNTAFASLAVFNTPDAAQQSLGKVTDSVKGCTGSYTVPDDPKPPATWQVGDTRTSDGSVSWALTLANSTRPWICSVTYTVVGNLASTASTCGRTASDGASRLVSLMLDKATS